MPGVLSNTKYKCVGCGTIADFTDGDLTPCSNCGAFHWEQITIVTVCDFCASTDVRWTFPAASFEMSGPITPGPHQMSADDWAACNTCKDLILLGDRGSLTARAMNQNSAVRKIPADMRPLMRAEIRRAHDRFFAHRTGDPVPHEQEGS